MSTQLIAYLFCGVPVFCIVMIFWHLIGRHIAAADSDEDDPDDVFWWDEFK